MCTGGELPFLNFGPASVTLPPEDDGISEAISPPDGFRAFGTNYANFYVCILCLKCVFCIK